MKKLILLLLFLTLIKCSKDDEVTYYRCDSYANNTLEQVEKQKNCVRGRVLQYRILIITWMLSEVMVETVQKFNRIEASDQSTIQLSLERE